MAAAVVFTIKPDLIALDIDSTVYCGLDFHELLRMNERGRCIPVVYLSATCTWIQRENVERFRAMGIVRKAGDGADIALKIAEHVPMHLQRQLQTVPPDPKGRRSPIAV